MVSDIRGWALYIDCYPHKDAETRRADLIQLERIASGYPSRERFLTIGGGR
jgi:hypothetical protein